MAKLTKRAKMIREKVEHGKLYDANDALDLLKSLSGVKFDESIEVSVNLGVDPRKSDQVVRGSTVLPQGDWKDSPCGGLCPGSECRCGEGSWSGYRRI